MKTKSPFQIMSECPCGRCEHRKKAFTHPICMECNEDDWLNFKKDANQMFVSSDYGTSIHKPFSFLSDESKLEGEKR